MHGVEVSMYSMYKIGVLGLQGSFAEHITAISRCGAEPVDVRFARQLDEIDGLIIPGGESTAIAILTADNADPIFERIRARVSAGMPIYGTCMGSIFLAREIEGSAQGRLALMDIKVRRNAFGPQRCSFETALEIACLSEVEDGGAPQRLPDDSTVGKAFPAVFIRAPIVLSVGPSVEVLCQINEGIVMARQDNMLVTAFHPELTDDLRVHRYFLDMVRLAQGVKLPAFDLEVEELEKSLYSISRGVPA